MQEGAEATSKVLAVTKIGAPEGLEEGRREVPAAGQVVGRSRRPELPKTVMTP